MRLHVSLKSVPEIGWLPRAEQRRIWRQSLRDARVFGHWQTWVPLLIYLGIAGTMLIAPQPTGFFAIAGWIYLFFCMGPAIAGLATVNIAIRRARPYMRARVAAEFGQPHCWDCGYSLTGNESGLCPKCGSRLTNAPPGQGVSEPAS
jgi:hypothetical protein